MKDIIIGRSEADREKFGKKGIIYLGKHYIKMGSTTSLSNEVYLDVNTSHVVFICGKRGGGKCLVGDTKIVMGDGSLRKISDLEQSDLPIMSLDQTMKIKPREKENFYKRVADDVREITLKSGKKIRVTSEHPLLTLDGWTEADELTVNTLIATPRRLNVFGERNLPEDLVKLVAYKVANTTLSSRLKFDLTESKSNYNEEILKDFLLSNKTKATIPKEVFELPKHKLSMFLNRIFSAKSALQKENEWTLSFEHDSEDVLFDLQHILLRFGIVATIKTNKLYLKDSELRKFLEEIGLFGELENTVKRALLELPKLTTASKVKSIPTELIEKSTDYFDDEETVYPNKQGKLETDILTNLIVDSDIYWDEITQIKKIDGDIEVYDFTVPKTHNFVANDVIVHNSYTMGVMAEGVADLPEDVKQNLSIILLDTMGVYWTMKYENKQDADLLEEWGLKPKSLDVQIFTPKGYYDKYKEEGIPTDYPFAIKPSELSGRDWNLTFGVDEKEALGVLIDRTIHKLNEKDIDFDIDDIIKVIEKDDEFDTDVKNAAKNRFLNSKDWGLFSKDATKLSQIAMPGQVSVLDVSCYATTPGAWNIKNLVVGLVSDKLFVERMLARKEEEYDEVDKSENPYSHEDKKEKDFPLVWLIIDEAHEFLPNESEEKTLATDPLVTILREGRQPGISLVLATQQPGKIHSDVMTQSDTVISHRITAKRDTEALSTLMQSYMRKGLDEELDNLPREKGAAVIFDDTNEKLYPMRIRPRFTWHGGSAPTALDKDDD